MLSSVSKKIILLELSCTYNPLEELYPSPPKYSFCIVVILLGYHQKRPPIVNKIKKVVGDVDGFTKIHYLAWILYAFVLTILSIFVARGVWVLTHQDTPSATMGHDDFGIVIDAGKS